MTYVSSTPRLIYVNSLLKKGRHAAIVQLMKEKGGRKQKQVEEQRRKERKDCLFIC